MSYLMLFDTLMLLLLPLAPRFKICLRGRASTCSTELKYITDKEELLPFCFVSLRMWHNPNQRMSLCLHALYISWLLTAASRRQPGGWCPEWAAQLPWGSAAWLPVRHWGYWQLLHWPGWLSYWWSEQHWVRCQQWNLMLNSNYFNLEL